MSTQTIPNVDLNLVMKAAEPRLASTLGPSIPLSIALTPGQCMVRIEPGELERVLAFFASNARRRDTTSAPFSMATTVLDLDEDAAREADLPPGKYAGIRIIGTSPDADDGQDPLAFDQIFEPRPSEAHGDLDLFTACVTVKMCDGAIKCDTIEDLTIYTILLPLAEHDAGQSSQLPTQASAAACSLVSILIVDDDAMIRTLLRQMLMQQGFQVFEADGGNEALSILEREREISLMLTDVVMPEMNGCELGTLVAKCRPGIHILYTSGYVDDFSWRDQFDFKAHFLQKPFTQAQLCDKIRNVIGLAPPENQRELAEALA